MALLLLAAALAASEPSPEAQRLGLKLAAQGTLASLLPLMKSNETEELLKEDPKLSVADRAKLRATADRVFKAGYDRIIKATGDAYARELGVTDLQILTRFYDSPAAERYRGATPSVIMTTIKSLGQLDFKGDVRRAFCAETKRLCIK